MGKQNMADDILTTTVCIDAVILNQRPLISVIIDKSKEVTLNHFLIGSPGSQIIQTYSKEYESHWKNFNAAQKKCKSNRA